MRIVGETWEFCGNTRPVIMRNLRMPRGWLNRLEVVLCALYIAGGLYLLVGLRLLKYWDAGFFLSAAFIAVGAWVGPKYKLALPAFSLNYRLFMLTGGIFMMPMALSL